MLETIWLESIKQGLYGFWIGIKLFFSVIISSPYLIALCLLGIVSLFVSRRRRY